MRSLTKYVFRRKPALILGLATLAILAPNPAKAFTTVDRSTFTDTQFQQMLFDGDFTESFVAESRIGNNGFGGNGEREFGINTGLLPSADGTKLVGGTPVAKGDRTWQNGKAVDFILEWTGSVVNYTVGGQLLSSNLFKDPVTDIFLRTFATNNSSMTLTNLFLDGKAIGQTLTSSATGSNKDADYIQLSAISNPFKLTGQSIMSWTGSTAPQRSQLAYQIKVGHSPKTSVPEPGMIGAIFFAATVSVVSKKKKEARTGNI